ncbi:hypothetical protein KEM52_005380 [Ascosphaera acerosa]|nr:hypothetical protein KEM52_005380 [Ascosphaera acerosa]
MFANALKSFQSNINSNYQYSAQPAFTSGPWKVHDGKKKSTGDPASIFILDKKALSSTGTGSGSGSNGFGGSLGGGRGSTSSGLRRAQEEAIQRLKKEASSLARLRHPSILQVLEPVEETRSGGLMFATEPVTSSLAIILQEKDDQDIAAGGRAARYVSAYDSSSSSTSAPSHYRRELEIDEIEIQKGLLQVAKALEFLHESAGLVHGNLNPEAIYVNTKSDWKLSGLGFSGPPDDGSDTATTTSSTNASIPPLSLSDVLHHDPRLSPSVQLNLDYTSPDFVIDANISPAADMYSLGLLIVALYNSPHRSPIKSNQNPTTYRNLLTSASTTPTPSNSFLCSRSIPTALKSSVLPTLLTRRPAQRANAREFQQSRYFDNVLVSTIRFLESFPAKTQSEKGQFLRGLRRVLDDFPGSVLQRKVLPALLEEAKDRELLPLILQNVMRIVKVIPGAVKVVPETILPKFKEIFLSPTATQVQGSGKKSDERERDNNQDAALMVMLNDLPVLAENCGGRQFKEDVLPLVRQGLKSQTHALIDSALKCLPVMLPILDFASIKDDVFPPIAHVFAYTNSLQIKTRALDSFHLLCGGDPTASVPSSQRQTADDDLTGVPQQASASATRQTKHSSSILDKYTVQEKLVPLLKVMKTKEPAVMMASLRVLQQVSRIVEIDFLAVDVLPLLWQFSLGPLLSVKDFNAYMTVIKEVTAKIEREHRRKLMALAGSDGSIEARASLSSGGVSPNGVSAFASIDDGREQDVREVKSEFEKLVLGHTDLAASAAPTANGPMSGAPADANGAWGAWGDSHGSGRSSVQSAVAAEQAIPTFSWSTAAARTTLATQSQPHSITRSSPAMSPVTTVSGRSGSLLSTSNSTRSPFSTHNVSAPTLPASLTGISSMSATPADLTTLPQPMQPLQPLQPLQPASSSGVLQPVSQQPSLSRPQPTSQHSWTPGLSPATPSASPFTTHNGGSLGGSANPATRLQGSNILSGFATLPASGAPMQSAQPAFSIPPPPSVSTAPTAPASTSSMIGGTFHSAQPQQSAPQPHPMATATTPLRPSTTGTAGSGLDKYASLL